MGMRDLKISPSVTRVETDAFRKYLNEIARVRLLEPYEEVALAKLIQKGDEKALETLVKANLRFVVSVAKQYQNQWLSLSELVTAWNEGALKAAQRFDHTKGFKFISYAVRRIRQYIFAEIATHARVIRIPWTKTVIKNKVKRAYDLLEQIFLRAPTAEEIAEYLQIKQEHVDFSLALESRDKSLDAPASGRPDDETPLLDHIENTSVNIISALTEADDKRSVKHFLKYLEPTLQLVICMRYGIGTYEHTKDSIAEELGREHYQVKLALRKAEKIMRELVENKEEKNIGKKAEKQIYSLIDVEGEAKEHRKKGANKRNTSEAIKALKLDIAEEAIGMHFFVEADEQMEETMQDDEQFRIYAEKLAQDIAKKITTLNPYLQLKDVRIDPEAVAAYKKECTKKTFEVLSFYANNKVSRQSEKKQEEIFQVFQMNLETQRLDRVPSPAKLPWCLNDMVDGEWQWSYSHLGFYFYQRVLKGKADNMPEFLTKMQHITLPTLEYLQPITNQRTDKNIWRNKFIEFINNLEQKRLSMTPTPESLERQWKTMESDPQRGGIYQSIVKRKYKSNRDNFLKDVNYSLPTIKFKAPPKTINWKDEKIQSTYRKMLADHLEEKRLAITPTPAVYERSSNDAKARTIPDDQRIGIKFWETLIIKEYGGDRQSFIRKMTHQPTTLKFVAKHLKRHDIKTQKLYFRQFLLNLQQQRASTDPTKTISRAPHTLDTWSTPENKKIGQRFVDGVIKDQYSSNWDRFFIAMGFKKDKGPFRFVKQIHNYKNTPMYQEKDKKSVA